MRNLVFILIAVFAFSCRGTVSNEGFVVKGTIKGLKQKVVYIERRKDGNWEKLDSCYTDTVKGTFELKGKLETPEFLSIGSSNGVFSSLFVENSVIEFKADSIEDSNPHISGSKVNDEYRAFSDKSDTINKELFVLEKKYVKAKKSGDTVLTKTLWDQIDKVSEEVDKKDKEFSINYIKQNPKSFVSPFILFNKLSYQMEVGQMDSLVKSFDTTLNKSVYVKLLNERIDILKKVAIGQPAPDFTMNDSTGNPVKLSSLYGKYLLVDFWASWCGPCRHENPNVVAAFKEFSKKGFDILGVSLDKEKSKWTAAIKKDNLSWHHVSDLQGWKNSAAKLYGINSIPSNILLDQKGIIIGRNLRGEDLKKKLKEILK